MSLLNISQNRIEYIIIMTISWRTVNSKFNYTKGIYIFVNYILSSRGNNTWVILKCTTAKCTKYYYIIVIGQSYIKYSCESLFMYCKQLIISYLNSFITITMLLGFSLRFGAAHVIILTLYHSFSGISIGFAVSVFITTTSGVYMQSSLCIGLCSILCGV